MDGQETVPTEREQERLRRYLASAFDGEDDESGHGDEGTLSLWKSTSYPYDKFQHSALSKWTADHGTITLRSAPDVTAELSLTPILFPITNITHKAYFSILL